MTAEDFKGVTLTPRALSFIIGIFTIGGLFWGSVYYVQRQSFQIEAIEAHVIRIEANLERINQRITDMERTLIEQEIAINRLLNGKAKE